MKVDEKALELHSKGYNCAQSVLVSLEKYTGIDTKTALAAAGGLGGGCRCGEICGALTGGIMALGMHQPFTEEGDMDAKARISVTTKAYTSSFKEKFRHVRCIDLKVDEQPCDELIAYAAALAEEVIINDK